MTNKKGKHVEWGYEGEFSIPRKFDWRKLALYLDASNHLCSSPFLTKPTISHKTLSILLINKTSTIRELSFTLFSPSLQSEHELRVHFLFTSYHLSLKITHTKWVLMIPTVTNTENKTSETRELSFTIIS